jgi:uncharacterized repeat protein (TIGR01451 family)
MPDLSLIGPGQLNIDGAIFTYSTTGEVGGSGIYPSFLRLDNQGDEQGFNTDATKVLDNVPSDNHTHSLLLSDLAVINIGGTDYYEFRLDLNQISGKSDITLDALRIYTSANPATGSDFTGAGDGKPGFGDGVLGAGFNLAYDMGSTPLDLISHNSGLGHDDYVVDVPVADFNASDTYVTLYSAFTGANDGFEQWRAVEKTSPVNGQGSFEIEKDYSLVAGGPYEDTGSVDHAGQTIYYQVQIFNSGTDPLTGLGNLTDSIPDANSGLTYVSDSAGDLTEPTILLPQETITFTTSHVVTQSEIDNDIGANNNNIDIENVSNDLGFIDNTATETLTDTTNNHVIGPESSSVATPIVYNPSLEILKTYTTTPDGDGLLPGDGSDDASGANGVVDHANQPIDYTIVVTNNGNVDLTNVVVSDPNADPGSLTYVTDSNNDATQPTSLAPGESETFSATHTVTQTELDNNIGAGNGVGVDPGFIDNTATASSDQAGPVNSSVSTPIDQDPAISVVKAITSITDDDDAPGKPATFIDGVGDIEHLQFSITNTGNVTLNDPTAGISDNPALDPNSLLYVSGDANHNGLLDAGETWVYTASHTVTQADLNAAATDQQMVCDTVNVTDTTLGGTQVQGSDEACAPVDLGPGVRTPGFWINNGSLLWDGNSSTFPKAGGLGITTTDLLYKVDVNGDGVINGSDSQGGGYLLIGDWNHDGITDDGEHTLLISRADAITLLSASLKQQQDGRWMLGRDLVATWLNYLAGNGVGPATGDPYAPHHLVDDTIIWLTDTSAHPNTLFSLSGATNDLTSATAVKLNSAVWNTDEFGLDWSASFLHTALDGYNNTGMVHGNVYAF